MSLPDFFLELSRVLIGLGLAVFIGVPLALLVGRKKKILLEGEEGKEAVERDGNQTKKAARRGWALGILFEGDEGQRDGRRERLGRAKFVAAGALLVGVLLETQVLGSALSPRHVWRAVAIFLLLAALVYSVMVVAPKERYYDERSSTFEENLRAAWNARRDAARARGSKIDFFGFLLALAALVLG
ncbi:MAG TPA: hypothetical protein VLJ18_09815 [Thermoanaerobaculia bacterium]|nr:hypothetical protein [Thermoanaerobaculia bacterium]